MVPVLAVPAVDGYTGLDDGGEERTVTSLRASAVDRCTGLDNGCGERFSDLDGRFSIK